jgi:hypothetical protein
MEAEKNTRMLNSDITAIKHSSIKHALTFFYHSQKRKYFYLLLVACTKSLLRRAIVKLSLMFIAACIPFLKPLRRTIYAYTRLIKWMAITSLQIKADNIFKITSASL